MSDQKDQRVLRQPEDTREDWQSRVRKALEARQLGLVHRAPSPTPTSTTARSPRAKKR
ncbi:hypothetical protein GCM10010468_49830 [Actinocorallia longicatena]|uniref:Uncharacterized protein n=1 Tax=Actinocorallia longicatena TaxID=111803 RepID=A0ABP6QFW1_9ACTN